MARGQHSENDPNRKVHRDRFTKTKPVSVDHDPAAKGLGGNFGQGAALEKNESGRGYHVKGAPGFR
jgi:hypothetical protein